MTYNLKYKTKGLFGFKKEIKNIKGHLFLKENPNIIMIILDSEERIFLNMENIEMVFFDDGWFKIELQKVNEDSQGKAVLNKG